MKDKGMSRRAVLGAIGGGAAGAMLPAAAFAQGSAAALAFGYQNTSWGVIGMIAEAEDLFKKAGGNVSVFKFSGGKETRDAMVAGRIDIGVLGATPFVVGAAQSPVVGIGMAMYAGKTLSVVAGTKSGIASVADLKGKRVGSQLGSSTDSVFQNKILQASGLTPKDIQVVNIPHQNHIAALISGSIDAFANVEPFPSVAEADGLGKVIVDYEKFDITPVVLVATKAAVDSKREAVIAFLSGWLAAVKLFNNDRARAAAIVKDHFAKQGFQLSDKVVGLMLSKLDVTTDFIPDLPGYLTAEADTLVKRGQLAAIPDWSKSLDRSLLQEAMKRA
jgi:NitT/TauT family transport system substrate-binding protein